MRTIHPALRAMMALCSIGLVGLAGCGDDGGTKPLPGEAPPCGRVLVVTTDYNTGSICVIDADSSYQSYPDLTSIHPDAVARYEEGLVYVVNRLGADNVQVLDPADGMRTLRQFSVGPGTNPHDIALVAQDRAYVARYGSVDLLEVDPRTGARRDSISLARFADADGLPEMDRLFYRAPYLYVSLQRIDFDGAYLPVPPSMIAVIDTRTNDLVDADPAVSGTQAIALAGLNPSAPMVWDESRLVLLVPETGRYGLLDAGVERVDLAMMRPAGWLTREEQLGGDLIDFALSPTGRGYATISDPASITSLVEFDPGTGVRMSTLHTSDGYELADLTVTGCGQILVCDMDYEAPGLRAYDAATGTETAGRIETGLRPFELILLNP